MQYSSLNKKMALILFGLLAHGVVFANTTSMPSKKPTLLTSAEEENCPQQVYTRPSPEQRRGGLLNPPARPLVEDYDFNFFGDLLIWQAHENGLPIAVKNTATTFATEAGFANLQNASVEHLDFDYNTGFRLGIDADTVYDGWDVSLTWLRFDSDASNDAFATGTNELFASRLNPHVFDVFAPGTLPSPVYSHAHGHFKSFLNQLDLDLGREFFVSKWLTLRPHVGLRTTWLRQRLSTKYTDGIAVAGRPVAPDTEVHEKNKWWGLGLEGGLDSKWGLGSGFSFYGNLVAAIEYGFQKVQTREEIEGSAPFESMPDSYRISRPILDLALGVQWDHECDNGRCHVGVHAGWEHHLYFSQNQFHNDQSLGRFVANQGDLSYQGWTVGAHLAF